MVALLERSRLLPLLEDNAVANYWLGFLFAVASIVKLKTVDDQKYLNMRVPMHLFWFLIKFKMFVGASNKIWYNDRDGKLLLRFRDPLLEELVEYGLRQRLGHRNKVPLKLNNPYFWFGYIDTVIAPYTQDSLYISGKPEIIKQMASCLTPLGLPPFQMLGTRYLLFKGQELEQLLMFLYDKRPAPFHLNDYVTQCAPLAQTFTVTQEMLTVAQNESPWDLLSEQVVNQ